MPQDRIATSMWLSKVFAIKVASQRTNSHARHVAERDFSSSATRSGVEYHGYPDREGKTLPGRPVVKTARGLAAAELWRRLQAASSESLRAFERARSAFARNGSANKSCKEFSRASHDVQRNCLTKRTPAMIAAIESGGCWSHGEVKAQIPNQTRQTANLGPGIDRPSVQLLMLRDPQRCHLIWVRAPAGLPRIGANR